MKILLTGAEGMLGVEMRHALTPHADVLALPRRALDITDERQVRLWMEAERPDVIVNCAAFTAVDAAERDARTAFRANALGPRNLARGASTLGALLVHFSTDYVYDGAQAHPYVESDRPHPINVYGASKLAGERVVTSLCARHLVFRTSWLFASHGANFVRTVLRLAREREELRIVADQVGAPTSARDIARAVAGAILRDRATPGRRSGLFHLTNRGYVSFHGLAREALRVAGIDCRVTPITSAEYGAPAARPQSSRLDTTRAERELGLVLPHWSVALRECLTEMASAASNRAALPSEVSA